MITTKVEVKFPKMLQEEKPEALEDYMIDINKEENN